MHQETVSGPEQRNLGTPSAPQVCKHNLDNLTWTIETPDSISRKLRAWETPNTFASGTPTSHESIDPATRIKRPPNSFMLFRMKRLNDLREKSKEQLNHRVLSTRFSKEWKALSDEEKQQYQISAEKAKNEHRIKYPNYKYAPKSRKSKTETIYPRGVKKISRPTESKKTPRKKSLSAETSFESLDTQSEIKPNEPVLATSRLAELFKQSIRLTPSSEHLISVPSTSTNFSLPFYNFPQPIPPVMFYHPLPIIDENNNNPFYDPPQPTNSLQARTSLDFSIPPLTIPSYDLLEFDLPNAMTENGAAMNISYPRPLSSVSPASRSEVSLPDGLDFYRSAGFTLPLNDSIMIDEMLRCDEVLEPVERLHRLDDTAANNDNPFSNDIFELDSPFEF
ncbi:hypothetical protein HK098_003570 [Nowakowskiella sp. JEL0407]|nr:hypothetical protein HK098_003570 [Nowakowskiella sp. JEL0407]